MTMMMSAIERAQKMKRQHQAELMGLSNVVATGVGFKIAGDTPTTEPSVIVSVVKKLPVGQLAASSIVPRSLGDVKTDVIETGKIVAFQDPKLKMRPARPGVSIGHHLITAGTFGCLVQRGGQIFILSNNHVLANSNAASPGDAIWQPGRHDGGTAADQIGVLEQFIPIGFSGGTTPSPGCSPLAALMKLFGAPARALINEPGNNTVDCAIARPLSSDLVISDILNIGVPVGVGSAMLGTPLQKSGRTTGYTKGQIIQIDVTVSVDYGGKIATFQNQLMAGAMSQGGDSGSAVLDMDKRVVGLLYAGSDSTTILNPIQFVLDALQVQVVTV
jgi:hypothetical protein